MKFSDALYDLITKSSSIVLASEVVKRHMLAPEIYNSGRVSDAIGPFTQRFSESSEGEGKLSALEDEEPIFVFSAGWGSGSTLIQRLLISSGEVLVWGEPVDEGGPILRMAQTISPVRDNWPPAEHFRPGFEASELQGEWIANFAPEMFRFREAHRQFYLSWLAADAKRSGIKRWGLKEVRLTIDHARYLKWLFPKARFVFIYRDIYGSYLSIRRRPWLSVWPNYSATQIVSFAHHWKHLLTGFINHHKEVDGVLIRFEDLSSGKCDLGELADHLKLGSIDDSLLNKNVGGRSARRRPLILPEKLVLDTIAGDLRKELGYR